MTAYRVPKVTWLSEFQYPLCWIDLVTADLGDKREVLNALNAVYPRWEVVLEPCIGGIPQPFRTYWLNSAQNAVCLEMPLLCGETVPLVATQ